VGRGTNLRQMDDLHRIGDVRRVTMIDWNDQTPARSSGILKMRAQLNNKETGLLVVGLPIRELGKAADLLKKLHYFLFRGHTSNARLRPQDTCQSKNG